jgi:protoporphyrinogen oxidase
MKIGILGAGISGLSIGKLLNAQHEVELLEREKNFGGIARTIDVNGTAYHITGGHCFNSKYPEVLDFVFTNILSIDNWHLVKRNANIQLNGFDIPYPIEFSVKQIHDFDEDLAINITKDFLNAEDDFSYENLEAWFRKKFGNTLADLYFIPYNRKIWDKEPKHMSPLWVDGKLPIPNKKAFFNGLLGKEDDNMPHATFYYPNSNNQNTFIDALASGLTIINDYNVKTIKKLNNKKWLVNNEKEYDLIISSLPLNFLPLIIEGVDNDIIEHTKKLKYNRVTTMLWETQGTDKTWTYIPDAENIFHRYIHIGNFFSPVKKFTITEVVGERSYDQMVQNGKKDPFLIKPVGYHVSNHAYVVFDENYKISTDAIKKYINEMGLFTLGRFGQWEYFNMDICIKNALEVSATIQKLCNETV